MRPHGKYILSVQRPVGHAQSGASLVTTLVYRLDMFVVYLRAILT